MGKPTDLVQGTVDLLIMKTVALEPMHGWAIAQRIRQLSKDVLLLQQGSLYPALQRLERQGWVTAEWGGEQPARALLPAHEGRAPAARRGKGGLGAPLRRHPRRAPDHLGPR